MNNTQIGNKTERTISSILREHKYWVYNCPKSLSGSQPVDLIAINSKRSWLIDGKHVRINEVSFPLSRIEDNQLSTMDYAFGFAGMNKNYMGFAIEFDRTNEFYWLGYEEVLYMIDNNIKSIHLSKLKLFEEVLNEDNYKQ